MFDFEQINQSKFDCTLFRKSLWEGMLLIQEHLKNKTYLKKLETIMDGKCMIKLLQKHFYEEPMLFFQQFIDGVQAFEGSREVLVPIFMTNMVSDRFLMENMSLTDILASINFS